MFGRRTASSKAWQQVIHAMAASGHCLLIRRTKAVALDRRLFESLVDRLLLQVIARQGSARIPEHERSASICGMAGSPMGAQRKARSSSLRIFNGVHRSGMRPFSAFLDCPLAQPLLVLARSTDIA